MYRFKYETINSSLPPHVLSLPFQDSILLTDVGRSTKKQASSAEFPLSSSTPRDKGKKRAKETKGGEGGGTTLFESTPAVDRSQSWAPPSTTSSPSVFQSLLQDKSSEAEVVQSPSPETGGISSEPPRPQPLSRSVSNPATSDSELRQRRLERLESMKNVSLNSTTQEKDKAPLLPTPSGKDEKRETGGGTDEVLQ